MLTDSGGIQEETTALGVPCLTIRNSTERPVTVEIGSNVLVGSDPAVIIDETRKILRGQGKRAGKPLLWDGKAAERIVNILADTLAPHEEEDIQNRFVIPNVAVKCFHERTNDRTLMGELS